MLVRATGARTVVEFGTFFGISSLYIAAALRDNGGGQLISSEFEPGKIARAQRHIEDAGLGAPYLLWLLRSGWQTYMAVRSNVSDFVAGTPQAEAILENQHQDFMGSLSDRTANKAIT